METNSKIAWPKNMIFIWIKIVVTKFYAYLLKILSIIIVKL